MMRRAVDGASLAVFRIGFGAIVFWEVVRYLANDWVRELFLAPHFLFQFPLVPVSPWPEGWLYVHFLVLGVAALCVSLGLFYRVASALLA